MLTILGLILLKALGYAVAIALSIFVSMVIEECSEDTYK